MLDHCQVKQHWHAWPWWTSNGKTWVQNLNHLLLSMKPNNIPNGLYSVNCHCEHGSQQISSWSVHKLLAKGKWYKHFSCEDITNKKTYMHWCAYIYLGRITLRDDCTNLLRISGLVKSIGTVLKFRYHSSALPYR